MVLSTQSYFSNFHTEEEYEKFTATTLIYVNGARIWNYCGCWH